MKVYYLSPVLVSIFAGPCSFSADEGSSGGLNFLWLSCEDITPALGCYGDTAASTPNLDRLASEGIRYTRAFSVAGVSAPSRHAIITGMYPTSTGGHNMRTIRHELPDLPFYSVVLPPEVKCFSELLRARGYFCTNNQKTDYQFVPPLTAWDECHAGAHWRNRPAGKPFFSVFNFTSTHESKIWEQKGEPLLVNENRVPIPPYYPEHPVIRRDVARKYSNIAEMDRQAGIILDQLEKDGLLEKTVIFFFSDHGGMLPREKRELYDSGIRVPLIIRLPGKQRAGEVCDELVSFVDFAPAMLSLAGIAIPGYMQGQAFLGERKSHTPRKYIFAGRDRMDTEYDMVRAVRDERFKYLKNYYPGLPFVQDIKYRKQIPMMEVLCRYDREDKFEGVQKLWWRKQKPVEELYDTWNDPYEFVNLARDTAFGKKLSEMRKALADWQDEFGDRGFTPERELIRQMWGGEIQPVTAGVEFMPDGRGWMELRSASPGASIAFQRDERIGSPHWELYTSPLEPGSYYRIRAVAHRIGFLPADTAELNTYEK